MLVIVEWYYIMVREGGIDARSFSGFQRKLASARRDGDSRRLLAGAGWSKVRSGGMATNSNLSERASGERVGE